jgi:hypothetical protein
MPRFNIEVQLLGKDGNAFSVMSSVTRALKRDGQPPEVIEEFKTEAMSGDYDHVIRTCMKWVEVS